MPAVEFAKSVVDGAEAQIDLPWRIDTPALFGIAPVDIERLSPNSSITGRQTRFTVQGNLLDSVTEIRLNDMVVDPAGWQLSPDATALAFDLAAADPGVYSLRVTQSGRVHVLPAALLIEQALSVDSAGSDNARGADKVSDSGGNTIAVSGLGFQGDLDLHWLAVDDGQQPTPGNRIQTFKRVVGGIQFIAPPAVHVVESEPQEYDALALKRRNRAWDHRHGRRTG